MSFCDVGMGLGCKMVLVVGMNDELHGYAALDRDRDRLVLVV
jgi:hypothetical protein